MTVTNILEKINQSALKFLEPLTPEKTYATIVEEAVQLVGAHHGSILLEEHGELVRVYGSSPITYQTKNRRRGNTYRSFKYGKTIVASMKKIGKFHKHLVEMGIKSTIFIPLSYQSKTIGVLTVNSQKEVKLSDRELDVLELFGSMASLAIRKVRLYDQASNALKARDLFISMASHELKTPLTAIRGYVEMLGRKLQNSESAEARWVKQLDSETKRLVNLVHELLQTSNIKTGKLRYVWTVCSLREVIRRVVDNFHFTHPNRIIYVADQLINVKDNITGDFDKLVQVFSNLVNNAVKFSPEKSPIQIRLSYREGYFYSYITDQGQGIAEHDLPKIFDEFYKGHGNTIEGMGLGLFLVKKIIMEHRGGIEVKSSVGKGTTMIVKLPEIKI